MRHLLLSLLLVLVPTLSLASQATCYSNGRMIYSHNIDSVIYDQFVFAFQEPRTHRVIFVSGDCVVKV